MNPAVNAGILSLVGRGRLSATSLLVDGSAARQDAPALRASGLQVGLHLNFTESFGQPGLCLPLGTLIRKAWLGRLPADAVRETVQRQLALFQDIMGRAPDYVDGHQHVHQLPCIRDALLESLPEPRNGRPWIRDVGRPRMAGLPPRLRFKAAVIAGLGAAGLRQRARARGHAFNPGFLGVYDFQGGVPAYERWMRRWLASCRDGDVLMCHPALGTEGADALSAQRQAEHEVLAGPLMGRLLAEHHLTIEGRDSRPSRGAHMNVTYQTLTPDFSVAPQLQPADMQALADAGFKSVIINRPDGEGGPEQPRSDDVLQAARDAGLQARYQPVVSGAMTAADVAEFAGLLRDLPAPVLAFCRSGTRCTNLFLAAQEYGTDQSQG